MPRRLVLWDIDGTILHGGPLFRECFEGAFAALESGLELRKIAYGGKTDRQICHELLEGHGLTEPERDRITEDTLRGYLDRVSQAIAEGRGKEVRVLPGVETALLRMEAEPRIELGILTGNLREGARLKLEAAGHAHHFDWDLAAFGDDHWDRYQLPLIAVARAETKLGQTFRGKQIVIIGDTVHDVNCGRSLGVRTIAVATGHPDQRPALTAAAADHFFENLTDTGRLLEAVLSY